MTYMMEDDEEKLAKEERKHTVIGGCIAAILLLLIVPPICYGLFTYTQGGQIMAAHTVTYLTYNGLPIADITGGIPDLARQSCRLDQASPKPANFEERQERLAERYETYVTWYSRYYNELTKLRQDTDMYEDPENIPQGINGAKIIYCLQ